MSEIVHNTTSAIKPRAISVSPKALPDPFYREMQHYGFIYADGSYSHERQLRGAMLVPRRPTPGHFWDPESREWYLEGEVMPPEVSGGVKAETVVGSENAGAPPTLEAVKAANSAASVTEGVEVSVSADTPPAPTLADLMKAPVKAK